MTADQNWEHIHRDTKEKDTNTKRKRKKAHQMADCLIQAQFNFHVANFGIERLAALLSRQFSITCLIFLNADSVRSIHLSQLE